MRNCYLLFLVFCSLVAQGQNYQIIQPGQKRYFTNEGGLLKGIRIDSSKTENGDLILYPFKTPRGMAPALWGSAQLDTNGGSWVGSEIRIRPDGLTMIDTRWGDTLFIKTRATLGEQWRFYDDTGSRYFLATVTSVGTAPVLNQTDSIKTITINVFNAGLPESGHKIDGKQLVLSKNHGLYETISLHTFPYPGIVNNSQGSFWADVFMKLYDEPFNGTIQTYKLVSFEFPDSTEIFNFEIGDIFERWRNHVPGYFNSYEIDSIMDKTVNTNGIIYTIHRKTYTDGANYGSSSVVYRQVAYGLMDFTGGKMPEEKGLIHAVVYIPDDTSHCVVGKYYLTRELDMTTTGYWYGGDLVCLEAYTWKEKFGPDFWRKCLSDKGTGKIIYSVKNNQPCGTLVPLSVHQIEKSHRPEVYPNPVTDHIYIKGIEGNTSYYIYSMDGRLMKAGFTQFDTPISVSELAPGTYILKYQSRPNSNFDVKKIVIQ